MPAEDASIRPRVLSTNLDSEESKADIINWLEQRLGKTNEPELKRRKHPAEVCDCASNIDVHHTVRVRRKTKHAHST